MRLSKEDKDFLAGVIVFIITASVLNLWLNVEWFTTLGISSVLGVVTGFIVDRLQK